MADIISRSKMSASELKAQHGDINFVENPKTGKLFFSCGSIVGYISPKVQAAAEAGTLSLADMDYAQCSTDGGNTWVDCLMMRATNNVRFTF